MVGRSHRNLHHHHHVARLTALVVGAALLITAPAGAAESFPEVIPLPNNWQPEGIAKGRGTIMYSGSRLTGDILAVNVRTGEVLPDLAVDAPAGRTAIGIEQDRFGRFFVAGGASGDVYVYDADGGELATYDFASGASFVNDVVVTRDAAWFTDSQQPVLYKINLERDGTLGEGEIIELSGDYQHVAGFNLNGIDATRNGKTLFAVQSNTGALYSIDPETGVVTRIDLGGAVLTNGDGILYDGGTIYVVRNRNNVIAVVELDSDFTSGTVVGEIGSDNFDVPTTMARFGSTFYLVNARFTTPAGPDTEYWITAVERP